MLTRALQRLIEEVRKPKKEKKAPTTLERFFPSLPRTKSVGTDQFERQGEDTGPVPSLESDRRAGEAGGLVDAMELDEGYVQSGLAPFSDEDEAIESSLWEYRAELLFQSSQELSQAGQAGGDAGEEDMEVTSDRSGLFLAPAACIVPGGLTTEPNSGQGDGDWRAAARVSVRTGEAAGDSAARKKTCASPLRSQKAKKEVAKKPWKQKDAVRGKDVTPDLPKIVRGKTSVLSFFQAWARPNFSATNNSS